MGSSPCVGQNFCNDIVRCNRLGDTGFVTWLFYPGMLFGSMLSWWGAGRPRPRPHEGTDFCMYDTASGSTEFVSEGFRIPAVCSGRVECIHKDFLGHSVYIRHKLYNDNGRIFFSIYGHVDPLPEIRPGLTVRQGDVFAAVADAGKRDGPMASHLHLSFAWVAENPESRYLTWDTLNDPSVALLVDPLELLQADYRVIDFEPGRQEEPI